MFENENSKNAISVTVKLEAAFALEEDETASRISELNELFVVVKALEVKVVTYLANMIRNLVNFPFPKKERSPSF